MPVTTTTIGTLGDYGLSDAVRATALVGTLGQYDYSPSGSGDLIVSILKNPQLYRAWMTHIAIEDADGNGLYRKAATVVVIKNTIHYRATFGQDEPDDDDIEIKQISLWSAASGGVMGERWILETAEEKDNIDEYVIECSLTALF